MLYLLLWSDTSHVRLLFSGSKSPPGSLAVTDLTGLFWLSRAHFDGMTVEAFFFVLLLFCQNQMTQVRWQVGEYETAGRSSRLGMRKAWCDKETKPRF